MTQFLYRRIICLPLLPPGIWALLLLILEYLIDCVCRTVDWLNWGQEFVQSEILVANECGRTHTFTCNWNTLLPSYQIYVTIMYLQIYGKILKQLRNKLCNYLEIIVIRGVPSYQKILPIDMVCVCFFST